MPTAGRCSPIDDSACALAASIRNRPRQSMPFSASGTFTQSVATIPPRVEYALTEFGVSLWRAFDPCAIGTENTWTASRERWAKPVDRPTNPALPVQFEGSNVYN